MSRMSHFSFITHRWQQFQSRCTRVDAARLMRVCDVEVAAATRHSDDRIAEASGGSEQEE